MSSRGAVPVVALGLFFFSSLNLTIAYSLWGENGVRTKVQPGRPWRQHSTLLMRGRRVAGSDTREARGQPLLADASGS
eukprot:3918648-Prymnesium_polylepis.1